MDNVLSQESQVSQETEASVKTRTMQQKMFRAHRLAEKSVMDKMGENDSVQRLLILP
jgi:hypothetical protein